MRLNIAILMLFFNPGLTQAQVIDTIQSDKVHIFSLYTGFTNYIERDNAMSPFFMLLVTEGFSQTMPGADYFSGQIPPVNTPKALPLVNYR